MCIGIPMQIVELFDGNALATGHGRSERLNTMLLSDVSPGAWVLAYQGSAIRTLAADEAQAISAALTALDGAFSGADIDAAFADLIHREPSLPPHLKTS